MKKYKININRPKISKEEIRSHQDFGKVLRNYSKFTKPLYNYPKFLNGLVAIAVVGVVVYYASMQDNDVQKGKTASENIIPPNKVSNVLDTINKRKDKVIEKAKDTVKEKKITFPEKSKITTSVSEKNSVQQKTSIQEIGYIGMIDTISVLDPNAHKWSRHIEQFDTIEPQNHKWVRKTLNPVTHQYIYTIKIIKYYNPVTNHWEKRTVHYGGAIETGTFEWTTQIVPVVMTTVDTIDVQNPNTLEWSKKIVEHFEFAKSSKISKGKRENIEDIDTVDVQDPKTSQWSKKIIYHPK